MDLTQLGTQLCGPAIQCFLHMGNSDVVITALDNVHLLLHQHFLCQLVCQAWGTQTWPCPGLCPKECSRRLLGEVGGGDLRRAESVEEGTCSVSYPCPFVLGWGCPTLNLLIYLSTYPSIYLFILWFYC